MQYRHVIYFKNWKYTTIPTPYGAKSLYRIKKLNECRPVLVLQILLFYPSSLLGCLALISLINFSWLSPFTASSLNCPSILSSESSLSFYWVTTSGLPPTALVSSIRECSFSIVCRLVSNTASSSEMLWLLCDSSLTIRLWIICCFICCFLRLLIWRFRGGTSPASLCSGSW